MSAREHKKLGEVATLSLEDLTRHCKGSSAEIQEAFAEAQQSKALAAIAKVYKIIEKATEYFIKFQTTARTKDSATTQKNLAVLADPSLDDTLRNFSLLSNEICDERDRDDILQNLRYARTRAMDENDKDLQGLRKLMPPSSSITPAENKTIPSSTSTATSPIQPSAESKPDAIEHVASITTATEARAAAQKEKEKEKRLAQRKAEIKAADARIDTAHKQATRLLAHVEVSDSKEQQAGQAADIAKAKTLAETCATLFQNLAKVPFTDPELAIEDIHDLMRGVIAKFLELQPLLRTLNNKIQAQTLLDAAAAQKEELQTLNQYVRARNLRVSADDDIGLLCSKLIHATNTRLDVEIYKNAEDTMSVSSAEERRLLEKVTTLFIECQNWLKELKEIPEQKPAIPIQAIHATLKDATADFVTLQREARRLKDTTYANSVLDNIKNNDISDFLSYVKKLNQQNYSQEDTGNLLANFLRFKNTPLTESTPQLEKTAEQKASILQEGFMLEVTQIKTARSNHEKIKQERTVLIGQLTSETDPKDIITSIRSIVTKTIGMKGAPERTTLQGNEKEQLQILVQDVLKTDYLRSIEPLLKEKFSEQAADTLLEALRGNKIDKLQPLLEQLSKPDKKEAKKEKTGSVKDWIKFRLPGKSSQSPPASPNKAPPKPADNSPKDSDNSSSSSNSSNTGPKS
jgi:hypothetical protein